MGTFAFAIHPRLRDEPLDARALAHARSVAADWRAAGLAVDLVEHRTPAGRRDGYVLTARSPTRVLRCECRGWRLLGRSGPRAGTLLWSIDVLVGRAIRAAETADGRETLRRAGVAMATAPDLAWRQVLEWIDGGPALPADLDAAVDQAAPKPAAGSGSRPVVAALLAAALALGALAGYERGQERPGNGGARLRHSRRRPGAGGGHHGAAAPANRSGPGRPVGAAAASGCQASRAVRAPARRGGRTRGGGPRVAAPGGPVPGRARDLSRRPRCHAEEGRRSRAHRLQQDRLLRRQRREWRRHLRVHASVRGLPAGPAEPQAAAADRLLRPGQP